MSGPGDYNQAEQVAKENVRHLAAFFRQGRNPAARVYESIGSDFFLAPAPGWLNLGLWEGSGSEQEAEAACRRLVETVAAALPKSGVVLDVGNGLGVQDPVISAVARPRTLVALNITEWQLRAGRARFRAAEASPVVLCVPAERRKAYRPTRGAGVAGFVERSPHRYKPEGPNAHIDVVQREGG